MSENGAVLHVKDYEEFIETYSRRRGAFGNPEGTGADFDEIVPIDDRLGVGVPDPDDSSVRVLVGRKGAGKTLYKRLLKDHAERNQSVGVAQIGEHQKIAADAEQTTLLETRHVIQVAHWFSPATLTEIWTLLWNRAILSALASYVIRSQRFSGYITQERRDELLKDYARVLRSLGKRPRSPFTVAKDLIVTHRSGRDLTRTLDDPTWDDLEQELSEILRDAPPFYFYMDAIDEDFAHAPMYWLRCQKGLFYYIMRVLRHSDLSNKLHIVICVRDIVMSSVYQSEHAPRYRGDPHIRVLNWGPGSVRFLLDRKAQQVDGKYFDPDHGRPTNFSEWIGLRSVVNRLGVEEEVSSYVLRHTQLVPRDVVLLGNSVGEILAQKRRAGLPCHLSQQELLDIVAEFALANSLTQITLCANQLSSEFMPPEASRYEFTDFYVASVEYQRGHADRLLELLRSLKYQRVPPEEIQRLVAEGRSAFEERSDVGSVLWQNGLLGFNREGKDYFYSLDMVSRFRLPTGVSEYVLHPALHEAAGLIGSERPVTPFHLP